LFIEKNILYLFAVFRQAGGVGKSRPETEKRGVVRQPMDDRVPTEKLSKNPA